MNINFVNFVILEDKLNILYKVPNKIIKMLKNSFQDLKIIKSIIGLCSKLINVERNFFFFINYRYLSWETILFDS